MKRCKNCNRLVAVYLEVIEKSDKEKTHEIAHTRLCWDCWRDLTGEKE